MSEKTVAFRDMVDPYLKSAMRSVDFEQVGKSLVLYEHQTHQQTVTRNTLSLFYGLAKAMVSMPGEDDRNAASKKFCSEFVEWFENKPVTMPYI
jgi:hypothetical protein